VGEGARHGGPVADAGDPLADLQAEALALVASHQGRPYYDAVADGEERDRYYAGVALEGAPDVLAHVLHRLLEETHVRHLDYAPSRELYPWVDLQPDGHLRHIYSGLRLDPEEAIRDDVRIARERAARLTAAIRDRPTMGAREVHDVARSVAQVLHFNCEHVVPQSWFGEEQPMRGDLHHLFACQPTCNAKRGNLVYAELADSEPTLADCGRILGSGALATFEPLTGKGAVARATLYFLLRYPGRIADVARAWPASAVPELVSTLVAWHDSEPVDEYERHRNAAIAEAQGNRNPLIDFPDLSGRLDFLSGFAAR
jgi:endonuclease G, mitochondrial